jgi:ATP synthase F1 complex assembly factor 2
MASFPDDHPDPLVRLQKEHWDPLFSWLKETHNVELKVAEGFSPARQTPETIEALRKAVEGLDNWELACTSGSACGAFPTC